MDYPAVSCRSCTNTFNTEEIYPECVDGKCIALIDQLSEYSLRLLNIRAVVITLNEMGLAGQVAKTFNLSEEDLFDLAWIEMELKQLRPQPEAP